MFRRRPNLTSPPAGLAVLREELHERLAGPVDHHQSTEDAQRDWTDIRRAYAHHVQRANAWELPLLPAVQIRQPVTNAVRTELAAGQAFENVGAAARQAGEALGQANLAQHQAVALTSETGCDYTVPESWFTRLTRRFR